MEKRITCRKCNSKVEVTKGIALVHQLVRFLEDNHPNEFHWHRIGSVKLIKTYKCPKCGHSFT